MFGKTSIDNDELVLILDKIGKVEKLSRSKSINIFKLDNIKVDIVNYPYKWLEKPLLSDNLKIDMGFRITLNRIAQENPSASAAELKQIFIKQAYGITIEKRS